MESDNFSKTQALKIIQDNFRSRFDLLKAAKENVLRLFRRRLEEKKIEEIKRGLTRPDA